MLVGFEPNATMNTAHHMLVYGCGEPGSNKPLWNCGEMSSSDDNKEESGSPCAGGSHSQVNIFEFNLNNLQSCLIIIL